jgi:hypothetical protein
MMQKVVITKISKQDAWYSKRKRFIGKVMERDDSGYFRFVDNNENPRQHEKSYYFRQMEPYDVKYRIL